MIDIDLTQLSLDELEQLRSEIDEELDSRDNDLDEDIDQESQKQYDRQSYVTMEEYTNWVNEMVNTSQITPAQGQSLINLHKHTLTTL